ncbi:MAG TPA: thiamine pyrophosphate-dependent enzyme [Symbiobacteriaceae bacterium]|nr:thiamine pyrophosphate-dependent enzyme [Symbiobacteriaceae bacterium]
MTEATAKPIFSHTDGLTEKPLHYCPGCSHGIIHRLIGEVLEELNVSDRTVGVGPVGCAAFCEQYFNVDFIGAAHGRAPAVATGVRRAVPDAVVFTYQGDGDLAAIGIAEAIHAAMRGEKITTIFVNNAIYGMTGGQLAPTTLVGMKTTTSPFGRKEEEHGRPLDIPKLFSGIDGAAYVASGSTDSPKAVLQTKKFIRKAFECQLAGHGYSLVSVLSNCPTNWGMTPVQAMEWIRTNLMPAYTMGELKTPFGAEPGKGGKPS